MFPHCPEALLDKFTFLIDFKGPNGCWEWLGALNTDGYGLFFGQSFSKLAHRLSVLWGRGPFDRSLTVDHLCKNRKCVNYNHFELVPLAVNVLRSNCPPALLRQQTECKRGHLLSGSNLLANDLARGRRSCRICHQERVKAHRKKKRSNWVSTSSKTRCKVGHLLTPENLVQSALRSGERKCKTCQAVRIQTQYVKKLAKAGKQPKHLGMNVGQLNAAKTHCPRGHELAGDNLDPGRAELGCRTCRICKNETDRARRCAGSSEEERVDG